MPQARRTDRIVVASWSVTAICTLLIVLISLLLSPTIVHSATPDLITNYELHNPLIVEFQTAIPNLFPPGAIDEATTARVAERMVRDNGVINDVSLGLVIAHRAWVEGDQPVLLLHPEAVTPAVLSALRDLRHPLADDFPAAARLITNPVPIDIQVHAKHLVVIRALLIIVALVGIIAAALRTLVTARRRYFYIVTGNTISLLSLVLVVITLSFPLLPAHHFGWPWSGLGALISAAQLPLLLFAVAGIGVGVFARLWALEGARVERRENVSWNERKENLAKKRDARTTKGQVRRDAIDAFFDERNSPASDTPVTPMRTLDSLSLADPAADTISTAAGMTATEPALPPFVPRRNRPFLVDGFEQVMAAIDRDPTGTGEVNRGRNVGPGHDDDVDEAAKASETKALELAQDRKEALERIDGKGSKLRTHLPR